VLLLVRWLYRREPGVAGPRARFAMAALRIAAVLLVLGALFGPYTETVEGERVKRHLILCIDTSTSMNTSESYGGDPALAKRLADAAGYASPAELARHTRIELVRDVLGKDRDYLARLAENFRLHLYRFDDDISNRLEPRFDETSTTTAERLLRELPELRAEGKYTRIGPALQELGRAFAARNEPVAGLLLFTDGRHTAGAPGPVDAAHGISTFRVFPVAVGDPSAAVNVGVSRIDAPEVALAGDEVFFTATVHARGLKDQLVRLTADRVLPGNATETLEIESHPFALPGEDETKKDSFRHTFHEPGRYDLRIGIPRLPAEAVEADNFQRHLLRVVRLRMRVLLVANKPSYTYRFLKPLLFRSPETIEASVILLDAEPEWPQEASEGIEPIREFPRTRRELAEYDVVILLDVDPNDPRVARADGRQEFYSMLEDWVKRGGGGLVMQAGRDDQLPRKYDTPEMRALLPVVPYEHMLDKRIMDMVEPSKEKRYRVTPAGLTHPIMRVLEDPEKVRTFWEGEEHRAANFYNWYTPVARAKSSTTVLAVRADEEPHADKDPDPLIAIQDYGLGKVLWLATEEEWRMRYCVQPENLYFWRYWSGIIRHLATYRLLSGNKRIKIWVDRADARYQLGESVRVEAKFLDENFLPVAPDESNPDSMSRTLTLRAADGTETPITVHAERTATPEGIFQGRITAGQAGTYSIVAEPTGGNEEVAEASFIVEDNAVEIRNPLLDRDTLDQIAKVTQGKVLSPEQFHDILKDPDIPSTSVVRDGEPIRADLWDRGWVLWAFVALLAAEWILRRRNLLL
jgi:hypothetical protein